MAKNIVILGAGFGGIRAAKMLAKKLRGQKEWNIILIDRNPVHIYYPKLFEEVIPHVHGVRDEMNCAISLSAILKGTGVEFIHADIKGIDYKGRTVTIAEHNAPQPPLNLRGGDSPQANGGVTILYEYLIAALGADADYFGIPGLNEYATVLRGTQDAMKIRERVETFLMIHNSPQPSLTLREGDRLSIVIGGAGATGVELAAALAYQFRSIKKATWSVTLVEALPRVLSMFPNELSQYAHTRLEKLGVHLMLDTCIKSVAEIATSSAIGRTPRNDGTEVEIVLAPRPLRPGEAASALVCDFLPEHEKRIQPNLLVWTGGVRANGLLATCGILTDKKGRVEVDEHMAVKGLEGVFAIGDNALLIDPASKQPVSGTAQAALREAEIAAGNIIAAIRSTTPVLYPFPKFPAIIPLAGRNAVALFGTRVIKGFPAWFLRHAGDCRYFASIIGWPRAIKKCIL